MMLRVYALTLSVVLPFYWMADYHHVFGGHDGMWLAKSETELLADGISLLLMYVGVLILLLCRRDK
jgi:predicted small integral membrane protein